ncbi:cysteine/Histidine-rich C1 domain family protein [Striga asiatica]|uniref:Cysteine/Histidine-rich C1 domain family protein n=1 Tax=Striga asiatica TaxID=4170 RepID=A0A5A7Q1K4_STRAF|nr:cysteine/Histidine-rich C1 domain family protein [Striga asiatica]
MYQGFSEVGHTIPYLEVENMADPDDANSWTCPACRLPIFSTPFVVDESGSSNLLLHDQCSDQSLPPQLAGPPLHPRAPSSSDTTARKKMTMRDMIAKDVGGLAGANFTSARWVMIESVGSGSISRVPCRTQSHGHRLTSIKEPAWAIPSLLFICRACEKQHAPVDAHTVRFFRMPLSTQHVTSTLFSFDFLLIHPIDGATFAPAKSRLSGSTPVSLVVIMFISTVLLTRHVKGSIPCWFVKQSSQSLLRLLMENEHASAMPRIIKTRTPGFHTHAHYSLGNITRYDHPFRSIDSLETIRVHEHPLIYHHHAHNDNIRVCNACAQIILPPDPFYSCADNNTCKDFFLHNCCSSFPKTFSSFHTGYCSFIPKVATKSFTIFECVVCKHKCNGSAYYIHRREEKYMDVVCALMPHLITHGAHGKAHILQGRWEIGEFYEYLMSLTCTCCLEKVNEYSMTSYACSNCRSFSIHPHCALLQTRSPKNSTDTL